MVLWRTVVDDRTQDEPSYSMRLVRPFLDLLRQQPNFPTEVLDRLDTLPNDTMLPISLVHKHLDAALARTGDPDLGLKAGCAMAAGDLGAIDYAVGSAATLRDALEVAGRYMCLFNRAFDYQIAVEGDRATVRWGTRGELPKAAADFQAAAFYSRHGRRWPAAANASLEFLFVHPEPASIDAYVRVFGAASIRFDAPFNGFAFDASALDLPLVTADPDLHRVIREYTERMLASLPVAQRFSDRVRQQLVKDLAGRQPSLARVARALGVSGRTLGRRLEEEGTTFKALLEDIRQRLGQEYVATKDTSFGEIAFLLGFSQTTAFHRAFKRWTGQTPLDYRRGRGR